MLCRIWKIGERTVASDAGLTKPPQLRLTVPQNNEFGLGPGDWVNVTPAKPPILKKKCRVCGKNYKEHTLEELVKHGLWVK
jgi:hypothetical protein